jgi:hypothetical protein
VWRCVANSNVSTVGFLMLQLSVAMEAHLPPRAYCMPIVRHTQLCILHANCAYIHNSCPWQARTGQNGVATMKERRHGNDVTVSELV